ncbi:MAG TPA: hypothetical protein VGX49_10600 [Jatrophihabitans sp.]|nr:hypothetical protein [Jatrophihabitans sp.]
MNPHAARLACARLDPGQAARQAAESGLSPLGLRRLLSEWDGDPVPEPGTFTVELALGARVTTMTVHIPQPAATRPGVLVVLHGAGNSGAAMLPYFLGLGERLGMAVLCPDAQLLDDVRGNLEVSGVFAKHFRFPRWSFGADDFPVAAMRWALENLDADPDRCVLAGVSMGGLACWNLAMRLWPRFAAAVPVNGALSIWEAFGTDRRTRFLLPNAVALPLFVVHGALDQRIPPRFDRASVAQLREAGHPALTYVEVPDGDHPLGSLHFEDGGPLVADLQAWLTGRRRQTDPVRIRHRALDDQHARAHWIGMGGVDPAGAEVIAERERDDLYTVRVLGAETVLLGLNGDRLEPGDPVTVVLNGEASTVRFEPSLETVAAGYREHLDPALTAEAVVTLAVADPQPCPPDELVGNPRHAHTF